MYKSIHIWFTPSLLHFFSFSLIHNPSTIKNNFEIGAIHHSRVLKGCLCRLHFFLRLTMSNSVNDNDHRRVGSIHSLPCSPSTTRAIVPVAVVVVVVIVVIVVFIPMLSANLHIQLAHGLVGHVHALHDGRLGFPFPSHFPSFFPFPSFIHSLIHPFIPSACLSYLVRFCGPSTIVYRSSSFVHCSMFIHPFPLFPILLFIVPDGVHLSPSSFLHHTRVKSPTGHPSFYV